MDFQHINHTEDFNYRVSTMANSNFKANTINNFKVRPKGN